MDTEFAASAADIDAFAALVGREGGPPSDPRSFVVMPALLASRQVLAEVGWDPDGATLRHVALDVVLADALRADTPYTLATTITGQGRLGRGDGVAFTVEIRFDGTVVATIRSVIQDLAPAAPADTALALADHVDRLGPIPRGAPVEQVAGRFPAEVVSAYVALVGDRVPIHEHGVEAAEQGLDGPVVPGYLLAATLAETVAAATGGAITGFGARFRQPVTVGAETTLAWARTGPVHAAVIRDAGGSDAVRASVTIR